jgi:hypothetical protein
MEKRQKLGKTKKSDCAKRDKRKKGPIRRRIMVVVAVSEMARPL